MKPLHFLTLAVVMIAAAVIGSAGVLSVSGQSGIEIQYSTSNTRTPAVPLDGANPSGDIFIFLTEDPDIDDVDFYLDGVLHQSENNAPWDFEGSQSGFPRPFNADTLPDGDHTIEARWINFQSEITSEFATFTIGTVEPAATTPPATATATTGPQPIGTYFAGDDVSDTHVSISGEDWLINGQPVGLLFNARMVNGAYDSETGWFPSTMLPFDPEQNTRDYIANMESWRDSGLRAIGINMQGGSNRNNTPSLSGDNQHATLRNNPYGTGTEAFDDWYAGIDSHHSRYIQRMGSIIRHADDLGLVVILGLFYFGQDEGLQNETAVISAVDETVGWINAEGWRNVVIEIANESHEYERYQHEILHPARITELVTRVQNVGLLASTSLHPGSSIGRLPTAEMIDAFDFVLVHGNGQDAADISQDVATIRARMTDPKPIVYNEDSTNLANFQAAIDAGAAWGYFNSDDYQSLKPDTDSSRWATSLDPAYWSYLGNVSTPPVPVTELRVEVTVDGTVTVFTGESVAVNVASD